MKQGTVPWQIKAVLWPCRCWTRLKTGRHFQLWVFRVSPELVRRKEPSLCSPTFNLVRGSWFALGRFACRTLFSESSDHLQSGASTSVCLHGSSVSRWCSVVVRVPAGKRKTHIWLLVYSLIIQSFSGNKSCPFSFLICKMVRVFPILWSYCELQIQTPSTVPVAYQGTIHINAPGLIV